MSLKYWSFLLALFCIVPFIQDAKGQEQLADYLDTDVAAVVLVSEPVRCLEKVLRLLELDDNGHNDWHYAFDLAIDPQVGFVEKEHAESVKSLLTKLQTKIKDVVEVGFVLHDLDPLAYSIVFKTESESNDEFLSLFKEISTCLSTLGSTIERNSSQDDSETSRLFFESAKEYIVFSNDQNYGNDLASRIRGLPVEDRNVLGKSRKYQRVISEFSKTRPNGGYILAYGSPEKISPIFYPEFSDEMRLAYQFGEMPAIGLKILFASNQSLDLEPSVSLDFIVPFTEPRVGFGALFTAYKPLAPLPPIPFDVTDLNASAYNPIEMHAISKEIFESANGVDTYEASKQKEEDRYSRSYMEDALPRLNGFIGIRFSNSPGERLESMLIEMVRDPAAMRRYVHAYTDKINDLNRLAIGWDPYKTHKYGDGHIISHHRTLPQSNDDIRIAGTTATEADREPAYFVNNEWSIRGNYNSVMMFLDALQSSRENSQVIQAINEARDRMDAGAKVFRIRFFSFWNFKPEQFETNRIREKYSQNQKKLNETLRREFNEHGFRLNIEDKNDCEAVFKSLICKALARRLGSVLFFYYFEEDRLRVKGGLYPIFNSHPSNTIRD